ncbi:DUF4360 domain-containing protein [Pilimelia columellifera]|uniref:Secreted protein n=1 Tax=Pilimelia columellifera subsp. columellifera TaxID=706583 RepID=A0ABP6B3P3_9ACTN
MKRKTLFVVALMSATSALVSPSAASAAPAEAKIEHISTTGSGCVNTQMDISNEDRAFVWLPNNTDVTPYAVALNWGNKPSRAECEMRFRIVNPGKDRFAPTLLAMEASYDIAIGHSGTMSLSYGFKNQKMTTTTKSLAPNDDDSNLNAELATQVKDGLATCTGSTEFIVRTEVDLKSTTNSGFSSWIEVFSQTGGLVSRSGVWNKTTC